ncbi:MAG TPA: glycosyltransferase, partial [Lacipirellulaceae bacterium]|nr:glycosyltransferase [Lacipirellulaceae bacterium]
MAQSQWGVPVAKLLTIHNGVDVERFMPEGEVHDGWQDAGPLVAVARLSPEKGIGTLLEAAAVARETTPDLRVEIAGDGPCRDALLRQRDELGLDDCVEFLGQIEDVPSLLHRARMFVLPSDSEGIALTLLEAMAAGLPVIATRVGGTAEAVRHEETGFRVPPQDLPAAVAAIGRLLDDPVLAAR